MIDFNSNNKQFNDEERAYDPNVNVFATGNTADAKVNSNLIVLFLYKLHIKTLN